MADKKIDFRTMANIKMDLEESDIPFRIDVIDYNSVSPEFKKIIDKKSEKI